MDHLANIIFGVVFVGAIAFFVRNVRRLIRNIQLGKPIDRTDQPSRRWAQMARIALGQSKMVVRPIAGLLHIVVYVGFVVINIELLEIVVDGFLGTHRVFAPYLGSIYDVLIATFEVFAFWSSSQ